MKTAEELRKELVSKGICSLIEATAIKGKQNLLNKLEEEDLDLDELDDALTEEKSQKETPKEGLPERGTRAWTDYVLNFLEDDEKKQGYPTCDGLRRLVEKFEGEIVSQKVVGAVVEYNDGIGLRSTITYEIKLVPFVGNNGYVNMDGVFKTYCEIADCSRKNTTDTYAIHPSATASTRAEGRCYRKALKLKTVTAEEMANDKDPTEMLEEDVGRPDEGYTDEYINSAQKALIESKASVLSIDVNKLVRSEFKDKYIDIDQLSRQDGGSMVKLINEYQQGTEIPEDIKSV